MSVSDICRRYVADMSRSRWIIPNFLIFLQIILTCLGIILALLVHLFKLLLRSMGEGCCTCCITVVEYSWIICSVTLCVFIVPIAIGAAVILIVAAGFGFKSWWEKRQKKKREAAAATGGGVNVSPSGQRQDEEQGTQQQNEENVTAEEEPSTNPSYSKTAEDVSRDELQEPLLQKWIFTYGFAVISSFDMVLVYQMYTTLCHQDFSNYCKRLLLGRIFVLVNT